MRTFWAVLQNDWFRTRSRAAGLLVMTVFTMLSIAMAVYITGEQQVKAHIAFVSQGTTISEPESSKVLEVTALSQKPPRSDLIKQKYDAVVSIDGSGAYQIETLKSETFRNMLLLLLKNPNAAVTDVKTERGVGVNIIGFMMMFLLLLAFSGMFAFADDKEQGQLVRIAATPASFGWYLAAHCVYCLLLMLPEYLLLAVLKACGWDVGFTLPEYAALMAVLGFLGISFALLLHTLIKKPDNANMLGNAMTLLTSILAGCLFSFHKDNAFLDGFTKLLPQKQILTFALAIQNGEVRQKLGSLLYVILFSLLLFIISCVILHRAYVKKPKACQTGPAAIE